MIKPFFLVIFVGFLLDLTENHSLTLMQPCTKNAQGETNSLSLWDTSATIQTRQRLYLLLTVPHIIRFNFDLSDLFLGISLRFLYAYITKIYVCVEHFFIAYMIWQVLANLNMHVL